MDKKGHLTFGGECARTAGTPPGTPLNYDLLLAKLKAYGFS